MSLNPPRFRNQTFNYYRLLNKNYLHEFLIFLMLALVAIIVSWKIIQAGVIFETADIHFHITWLQHFSKELSEGILYPRWLAGTNYGYGSPTFVFYPPLVYYIGSVIKIIGFNGERSIAILCLLAVFFSGANFYIYGRSRWNRIAAFSGALAYMTAPYIVYNIYQRGALAETWALPLIPLGLLLTDKAIASPRWRPLLAVFFTTLSLTHLPSLLLYTIFWLLYILCFLGKYSWKDVFLTIIFAAIGFGIASFYLLPALVEKSLVNIASMQGVKGGFGENLINFTKKNNTSGHVTSIFIYGLSSIIILSGIAVTFYRRNKDLLNESFCWIFFAIVLLFLMSQVSFPVWQASPTLQMVQFPWRLLGLLSFAISALFALITSSLFTNYSQKKLFFIFLILVIFFWNARYSYMLADRYQGFYQPGDLTSSQVKERWKVKSFNLVKTAALDPYTDKLKDATEYYPVIKQTGLPAKAPLIGQAPISVIKGNALMKIDRWGSYSRIVSVAVKKPSTLKIRTYYYPAWQLLIDGKPHPIKITNDGTIEFEIGTGSHLIQLEYGWTLAFALGVAISALSLLILSVLVIMQWMTFSRKS